jgi:heme oxygenase
MEGSTLGGQPISRHIEATLGLRDGRGYRYFQAYGRTTAARWAEFKAYLEERADTLDGDAAADAASETFLSLEAWLCAPSPAPVEPA